MPTPTTIVTGFLGVGKTSAILSAFNHRPEGERWAVLVNEFGEVGIDGAVLGSAGGVEVREIPGGCICCSAGLTLRHSLVQILREVRPDRLFIEPTGLAHPASVLDLLRQPGIRDHIAQRATIGLVDPRHVRSERHRASETWQDQVTAADVLVANKTDLCSPEDLEAFHTFAASLYPPKVQVTQTREGQFEPSWLELDPRPTKVLSLPIDTILPTAPVPPLAAAPLHRDEAEGRGWIYPQDHVFDRQGLTEALQQLARPCEALPDGILRLKGVFRTPRAWLFVNGTADTLRWRALNYRRDSRLEILAPTGATVDWAKVEALLADTLVHPKRDRSG